jgi:diazepam-binding inhibitor (GABA receptor modulating acyl-CoA-binding protein)
MSEIEKEFQRALEEVKELAVRPNNETLLRLYGLYKQATEGDVGASRPGMFDLVGRAKYDAWASNVGMSREEAMQGYIDLVQSLA